MVKSTERRGEWRKGGAMKNKNKKKNNNNNIMNKM